MINWGILGTASIAMNSIAPAIKDLDGNKLIAVASRTLSSAKKFAKKIEIEAITGYQNLLDIDDIDIVYIPLPNGLHYEWIMKALTAGKHVFVEKTACESVSQVQDVLKLSRKNNLAVVENFQFQFHSQHKYVLNEIESGTIGEIRCIRSSFGFPPFNIENNIRYERGIGGGALLDAGAYTIKVLSFLFGNNWLVDSAFLKFNKEFGVDWYGSGQLTNGEHVAQISFGFDNYYQCKYEVWGSKGRIISTRAFTAKPNHKPEIVIERNGNREVQLLPEDNHFKNILLYVSDLVKNDNEIIKETERVKIINQMSLLQSFKELAINR